MRTTHRVQTAFCGMVLLAMSASGLRAQFVKPGVSVSSEYAFSGKADMEGDGNRGRLSSSLYKAGLDWGQSLGASDLFGASLNVEQMDFDFSGRLPVPERLRKLSLSLKEQHVFSQQWRGFAAVNPGYSGSGDLCASEAFNVPVAAGAMYVQTRELSWIMGAAYDYSGRYKLIPMLGAHWEFAKDWAANLGFPLTNVTYRASDHLSLSADVGAEVGSYWVDKTPVYVASQGEAVAPSYKDARLAYRMIRLGLGAKYAVSSGLAVSVKGGAALGRVFDYYDLNGQAGSASHVTYDGDPTFFAAFSFVYSF